MLVRESEWAIGDVGGRVGWSCLCTPTDVDQNLSPVECHLKTAFYLTKFFSW